jgi:hypothetical protein
VPADASLAFYENRGQWAAPVRFAAALPGGTLFLEKAGFTYSLLHPDARPRHEQPAAPGPARGHAYTLHFEGAQAGCRPQGEEAVPGRRNYYLGDNPRHWASNVPGFRRVRYDGLYPGTAVVLYENAGHQLEYDIELQPRAKPAAVALRYEGADALTLDREGNLQVKTSVGTVTELAPRAWQTTADGQRQAVACAFELQGQRVRFRLGQYDQQRPLTIDPTVLFNSYSAANTINYGLSASYDAEGNIYSAGTIFLNGTYPTTPGAFTLSSRTMAQDVVVSKFLAQGRGPAALVYSSLIGGANADLPHRVVVNSQHELLIMGTTSSTDFPTTPGAFDNSFNGGSLIRAGVPEYVLGSDLFVLKLGSQGQLLAGTYLGGTANDGVLDRYQPDSSLTHNFGDQLRGDILTDAAGKVYLASYTASADFPVAGGGLPFHGPAGRNRHDALVCCLSADLRQLTWSTLLGGARDDAAYTLGLASDGSIYTAGGTFSADFPGTAGGYKAQPPGLGSNRPDAFVAHLSPTGHLLQSSYLGTAAHDEAYFLDLDSRDNVYLLGQTLGAYPTTPGSYAIPGGSQFIQQLNPTLTAAGLATVFGSGRPGMVDISPTAFGIDDCGRLYVAGWGGGNSLTTSSPVPLAGMATTPDAFRTSTDGQDLYFMRLGPNAAQLEYGSYYGSNAGQLGSGEHADGGASRFDRHGVLYHASCGGCNFSAFPMVPGAGYYLLGTASGFFCNQVTLKVDLSALAAPPIAGPDTVLCGNQLRPFLLRGANPAGGSWSGPGVSPAGVLTPPAAPGIYTLTYTTTGSCTGSATRRVTVLPRPTGEAHSSCQPTATADGRAPLLVHFRNATLGELPVRWDFGDGSFSTEANPDHSYQLAGTYRVSISLTAPLACPLPEPVVLVRVDEPRLPPNIITPNGDGENQYFVQSFTCLPVTLTVYSRWGQQVFRADNYANDWSAAGLSRGLYYVLLRDTAGQQYKGTVEVVY